MLANPGFHRRILSIAAFFAASVFTGMPGWAHCDTVDGPVVSDARTALSSGDVAPALKWVRPADEAEIRAAFGRTVAVRGQGEAARELADTWFFETLVRVHRAGEGAPYSGLKPAGTPQDPAVRLADRALEEGGVDSLVAALASHLTHGIRERFRRASELREHAGEGVEAGRAYVAAYVDFVHYAERLHQAAVTPAVAHDVERQHGH